MASANLRQRHAVGSVDQYRAQSSSGGSSASGSGSLEKKAADNTSSKNPASSGAKEAAGNTTPNASGNKRSLMFAIGGVLTLLGVAGYTFFRQPSVGIHGTAPTDTSDMGATGAAQTALESVAAKHIGARKRLDGLPRKERRNEANRLDMLTEEEVNAVLRAKEDMWCLGSPDSNTMRLRVDTNQVSSNSPIEDYLAWTPLGTNSSATADDKERNATRYMFSVFDGHAGFMCAEQLSIRLGTMLNESLGAIERLADKSNNGDKSNTELVRTIKQLERESGLDWDQIPLALTATFIHMDQQLVHGALAKYRKVQDLARMDELLGPAVSGSCGLVAVLDTKANEVSVGNAGDSRALLGVRLKGGRWKAVRLSEDQTAKNQNELARMAREHPGESSVIYHGRVLGGLMPFRAFGDCRYKWPLEAQQDLFPVLFSHGHRYATTPPNYITPPYVTAKPVIVKHRLSENDKFLVMASDGLYDQLSDDEVVGSVAQWYEANDGGKQGNNPSLFTEDTNAATHLIRTALSTDRLGRRSDSVIRRLLAIPAPHSRRFRDDISVTIVTFDRD
ncbi:[Pyruvate dehydrogenase [acetyl-transferring]]-phosphatase 1, mitochondrial [Coemansia sp. RSA 988]|nr:[Pyruvate dehydrogenase [acetyl-transferring]]-phosphatase 1, mitochondrial [Coemansia sp. RSA 988]